MEREDKVARVYAEALFEVGKEESKIDQFYEELGSVYELIEKDKLFRRFWEYPAISREEKKEVIEDIFRGKLENCILNFLKLLIDKGRERHLRKVVAFYKFLLNEYHNRMEVFVEVPIKLTDRQRDSIIKTLYDVYKKEIILKELLAPELIGGIRLRVGFKDIDGSIKKKLSILRQELLLEGE